MRAFQSSGRWPSGWAIFLCGWGVFQDAKLPWRQRGANLTPNADHTKLERNSVFPVADWLLARCAILCFSPILTLFFSMHLSSRRVLLQALVISVLIHSVILLSVVREFPARMDVPAATIRVLLGREVKGGGEKLVSKPLVTERQNPSGRFRLSFGVLQFRSLPLPSHLLPPLSPRLLHL